MLNILTLVGRIVGNLELKETETGRKYTNMTIAVQRPYKNVEGMYDTDFIDIVLWDMVAENTCEYCRKGDIVGIKGRLETIIYEDENDEKKKKLIVVADKVSFLSSKKEEN